MYVRTFAENKRLAPKVVCVRRLTREECMTDDTVKDIVGEVRGSVS